MSISWSGTFGLPDLRSWQWYENAARSVLVR